MFAAPAAGAAPAAVAEEAIPSSVLPAHTQTPAPAASFAQTAAAASTSSAASQQQQQQQQQQQASANRILFLVVVSGADLDSYQDPKPTGPRYTRDSLRNLLQLLGCKPRLAYKVMLAVFQAVDSAVMTARQQRISRKTFQVHPHRNGKVFVSLTRADFMSLVSSCAAQYSYKISPSSEELKVACSLRERRRCVVVLLCGTSGSGKSTLASILAGRLGITTVVSTDSIRHMLRSFMPREQAPLLWASTYQAGEHVGSSGKTQEASSERERALAGYKAQCGLLSEHLELLIAGCEARCQSLICEGVHLNISSVAKLMSRHPSVLPFLVYIPSESRHVERMAVRAKYMTLDPNKNRYVRYMGNIRLIQEYLVRKADKYAVPRVDNSNVDRSVGIIHLTVMNCLRRMARGEPVLDPATGRTSMLAAEYAAVLDHLQGEKDRLQVATAAPPAGSSKLPGGGVAGSVSSAEQQQLWKHMPGGKRSGSSSSSQQRPGHSTAGTAGAASSSGGQQQASSSNDAEQQKQQQQQQQPGVNVGHPQVASVDGLLPNGGALQAVRSTTQLQKQQPAHTQLPQPVAPPQQEQQQLDVAAGAAGDAAGNSSGTGADAPGPTTDAGSCRQDAPKAVVAAVTVASSAPVSREAPAAAAAAMSNGVGGSSEPAQQHSKHAAPVAAAAAADSANGHANSHDASTSNGQQQVLERRASQASSATRSQPIANGAGAVHQKSGAADQRCGQSGADMQQHPQQQQQPQVSSSAGLEAPHTASCSAQETALQQQTLPGPDNNSSSQPPGHVRSSSGVVATGGGSAHRPFAASAAAAAAAVVTATSGSSGSVEAAAGAQEGVHTSRTSASSGSSRGDSVADTQQQPQHEQANTRQQQQQQQQQHTQHQQQDGVVEYEDMVCSGEELDGLGELGSSDNEEGERFLQEYGSVYESTTCDEHDDWDEDGTGGGLRAWHAGMARALWPSYAHVYAQHAGSTTSSGVVVGGGGGDLPPPGVGLVAGSSGRVLQTAQSMAPSTSSSSTTAAVSARAAASAGHLMMRLPTLPPPPAAGAFGAAAGASVLHSSTALPTVYEGNGAQRQQHNSSLGRPPLPQPPLGGVASPPSGFLGQTAAGGSGSSYNSCRSPRAGGGHDRGLPRSGRRDVRRSRSSSGGGGSASSGGLFHGSPRHAAGASSSNNNGVRRPLSAGAVVAGASAAAAAGVPPSPEPSCVSTPDNTSSPATPVTTGNDVAAGVSDAGVSGSAAGAHIDTATP